MIHYMEKIKVNPHPTTLQGQALNMKGVCTLGSGKTP